MSLINFYHIDTNTLLALVCVFLSQDDVYEILFLDIYVSHSHLCIQNVTFNLCKFPVFKRFHTKLSAGF